MNSTVRTGSAASNVAQVTLFRSVYIWMAAALAITGLMALFIAESPNLISAIVSSKILFYGLLIGELGLVWYLSARINSLSFSTATMIFILYSILNGVTMSLIFVIYTSSSIALTFFITAGTFGAMSLYGYVTKTDLTKLGSILIMLLFGLIIASVVNIFLNSSTIQWITSILGVIIFVGLTAYDTQKIKRMLQHDSVTEVNDATQKIALMGALALYLDFINLFLYLLRFVGDRK